MKKCVLSVLTGALAMFIAIAVIATIHANKEQSYGDYNHIDYVSKITQEECYICGSTGDFAGFPYWGEDNVGIVNLNTFELMYLPINRYTENGKLEEEPTGYMTSGGMSNEETESYVHAFCFPDNDYADLQFSGVQYTIDRDSVQRHLCQTCLDYINDLLSGDQSPAEYAIVSFEDRTVQPILISHAWFTAGNFGVDCQIEDEGKIDLLIRYCKLQYSN